MDVSHDAMGPSNSLGEKKTPKHLLLPQEDDWLFTKLSLVLAQGQEYGATRENRTQCSANPAC